MIGYELGKTCILWSEVVEIPPDPVVRLRSCEVETHRATTSMSILRMLNVRQINEKN